VPALQRFQPDGTVDTKKLDQLLLDARDGGGIDSAERPS